MVPTRYVCSLQPDSYKCKQCQFESPFLVNLRPHSATAAAAHPYTCQNCDFTTFSQLIMLAHEENCPIVNQTCVYIKEPDFDIYKFQCTKCPYKYKRREHLEAHTLYVHGEVETVRWFKCERCSFQFMSKLCLNKHICQFKRKRKRKTRKPSLECESCSYKTQTRHRLRRHLLCHLKPEEIQWFRCDKCEYKAKRANDLKKHITSKHATTNQVKWLHCDSCNYISKRTTTLKKHKVAKHS